MTYKVCIDIGGTFTDCVVSDGSGSVRLFKTPSTPGAFENGFLNVLGLAAEDFGHERGEFLKLVDLIVHGTTVSTNALVVGNAASTGLLVNRGFPDVLLLREGPRKRSFEWRLKYPEPFVRRNLTHEVTGRIDARGNEVERLVGQDVVMAARELAKMGVQAVGVAFLWSIVNPSHELAARDILKRELPDLPIVLSHEVNPIPREYRRTISTAIDAALHPVMDKYIDTLTSSLKQDGYDGELLIANCLGGMMPPADIIARPIYSVMSGPTLAPMAAIDLTPQADIIVVDMGGTTFDVSAIRGRSLVVTAEAMVGPDLLGIPKVDVRSVGAGGGSIAWVDSGGLLKVGPQSAGARPGPACYNTGGTEPTVTDANVVLGIIDPEYFLGGRIKLDRSAAEIAVGKIANRLGVSLVDAAYAIHTTTNHNMVAAIEDITVNEGLDPRESYLVSGGGATGCHIAEMAEILGVSQFMVPKVASALSAYGGIISDIRFQFKSTLPTTSRDFAFHDVSKLLKSLRQQGIDALEAAGVKRDRWAFEYVYSGRYEFQSWDIEVPFSLSEDGINEELLKKLINSFHETHDRIYAIKDDKEVVEFVTWTVTSVGRADNPSTRMGRVHSNGLGKGDHAPKRRSVYIHSRGGMVDVPVYNGAYLSPNQTLEGPCVIEETTTTVLVLPDLQCTVDDVGNYIFKRL